MINMPKEREIGHGQIITPPSARPIKVNLRVRPIANEDRYEGELYGRRFPIYITRDDLRILSRDLAGQVAKLAGRFRWENSKPELVDEAPLAELAKAGGYAFQKIFADSRARSAVCQLLESSDATTIEIASENFFLPWELLYDGNADFPRIHDFWGARYGMSRCIVEDLSRWEVFATTLFTPDQPSIALQWDDSLANVLAEEVPYFENLASAGRIQLFKLQPLDEKAAVHDRQAFAEFCCTRQVNVSHYACHAHSDTLSPRHSYITVTNHFPLRIDDLTSLAFKLCGNPLIFLNACHTDTDNPLQTLDFVRLFFDKGARGVIVTESKVPDDFAAQFVKHFYDLFLQGRPIGDCLLTTKQYFIEQHRNPLGLIYAYYGDPALSIQTIGDLAKMIQL